MEDLQSPISEPSTQNPNVPTTSRRSASSSRKPSIDDTQINTIMKMGFPRKTVELAIRTLSKISFS